MGNKGMVTVLAAVLFLASCSALGGPISGTYGKIRVNKEVTESFQKAGIKDDHRYYTSGPDSCPHAIIAIDRRYVLLSTLWKERYLNPKIMKTLVENMQSRAREYGSMLHGFDILDKRGNDIGDRYSILSLSTTVRHVGENEISITTPPIDTYERRRIKITRPDGMD